VTALKIVQLAAVRRGWVESGGRLTECGLSLNDCASDARFRLS
jgi:hypothetical protein